MNERQMQFRVGVVVFATLIIGGVLASLNAPLPTSLLPWRKMYIVGIKVDNAPGVDQNTPVHKNGIYIGKIKSVEEQPDGLLLKAEINSNRPLYAEYEPHIRTTVIGDATIDFEFDFKHKRLSPNEKPVESGHIFNGIADESPFDAIAKFGSLKQDFAEAAQSLNQAGNEVSKLAGRLNDTLDEGNKQGRFNHLVETTDRAMTQFEATMASFNEIFGDGPAGPVRTGVARPPINEPPAFNSQPPAGGQQFNQAPITPATPPAAQASPSGPEMRQRLRQGLNELPDTIHEMRTALNEFRTVLSSADKNLRNLEGFTEPLGQKGADISGALLKAVNGLDQLVADFNSVTQSLNSPRGTIGRLLHDDKLYDNFNMLMSNANSVLFDLHDLAYRIKPVIEDARIFMDKIAVEPGRIITGGLHPSTVK